MRVCFPHGPALGLSEFLATARGIEGEISATQGDLAHLEFEQGVASMFGTDYDQVAHDAAVAAGRRRLEQLGREHVVAVRLVDDELLRTAEHGIA